MSGSDLPPAPPLSGNLSSLPQPLQAALADAPSLSSASASVFGSSAPDATDSAATSPGSAPSSSSAASSAAMSGASGGQPSSSATAAAAAGLSLPSISLTPDPDSEPDGLRSLALPPIDTHRQPGSITVPFEIVVVCRRNDVLLHPGGYQITAKALGQGAAKGTNTDGLLQRELRMMVRRRAQVDPLIRPKPRLKFLVETGGATTFWTVRRQLVLSNLDWPMTVQVAGPQAGYPFDERALK
jgi:hypothetical protein